MNMKKQLITFMMIFLGLSWACSEDEDNHLPVIEPEEWCIHRCRGTGIFMGSLWKFGMDDNESEYRSQLWV